jgi:hypothetical protein
MLHSNDKIIKHKVGLLNLAEELGNVSKACQIMGLSRDTFYRYRDAVEDGGVEALLERPRRAPNLKNRVDLETETAVVAYAIEYPAHGQVRVSNELRKQGVFVSASGVRSIWLRHDLANFKQRLKALEAKVAEDGICERFHKTILQEFYQVAFRKKIYQTIEQLQIDLDQWIDYYNNERTHQGKVCEGRTPMQTLVDGKRIWKEKFVG